MTARPPTAEHAAPADVIREALDYLWSYVDKKAPPIETEGQWQDGLSALDALLAELAAAREALARAHGARDDLTGAIADIIAIKGHLDTPYPDDPRWTPWTRFAERALARIDRARAAVGGGGQGTGDA